MCVFWSWRPSKCTVLHIHDSENFKKSYMSFGNQCWFYRSIARPKKINVVTSRWIHLTVLYTSWVISRLAKSMQPCILRLQLQLIAQAWRCKSVAFVSCTNMITIRHCKTSMSDNLGIICQLAIDNRNRNRNKQKHDVEARPSSGSFVEDSHPDRLVGRVDPMFKDDNNPSVKWFFFFFCMRIPL